VEWPDVDLGRRFADVGPVLVVGSYLSGLMCWRDLDVCLLAGRPGTSATTCPSTWPPGMGRWRVDLSVWLRDLHGQVADWHLRLRDTITDEQRLAVLRIKDVWHRLPDYPDAGGGWQIYTAVLGDGVRTREQFAHWLAANGFPTP
jgi:hypothetical protein